MRAPGKHTHLLAGSAQPVHQPPGDQLPAPPSRARAAHRPLKEPRMPVRDLGVISRSCTHTKALLSPSVSVTRLFPTPGIHNGSSHPGRGLGAGLGPRARQPASPGPGVENRYWTVQPLPSTSSGAQAACPSRNGSLVRALPFPACHPVSLID